MQFLVLLLFSAVLGDTGTAVDPITSGENAPQPLQAQPLPTFTLERDLDDSPEVIDATFVAQDQQLRADLPPQLRTQDASPYYVIDDRKKRSADHHYLDDDDDDVVRYVAASSVLRSDVQPVVAYRYYSDDGYDRDLNDRYDYDRKKRSTDVSLEEIERLRYVAPVGQVRSGATPFVYKTDLDDDRDFDRDDRYDFDRKKRSSGYLDLDDDIRIVAASGTSRTGEPARPLFFRGDLDDDHDIDRDDRYDHDRKKRSADVSTQDDDDDVKIAAPPPQLKSAAAPVVLRTDIDDDRDIDDRFDFDRKKRSADVSAEDFGYVRYNVPRRAAFRSAPSPIYRAAVPYPYYYDDDRYDIYDHDRKKRSADVSLEDDRVVLLQQPVEAADKAARADQQVAPPVTYYVVADDSYAVNIPQERTRILYRYFDDRK